MSKRIPNTGPAFPPITGGLVDVWLLMYVVCVVLFLSFFLCYLLLSLVSKAGSHYCSDGLSLSVKEVRKGDRNDVRDHGE